VRRWEWYKQYGPVYKKSDWKSFDCWYETLWRCCQTWHAPTKLLFRLLVKKNSIELLRLMRIYAAETTVSSLFWFSRAAFFYWWITGTIIRNKVKLIFLAIADRWWLVLPGEAGSLDGRTRRSWSHGGCCIFFNVVSLTLIFWHAWCLQ